MRLKSTEPSLMVQKVRQEVIAAIQLHSEHLASEEILALMCHLVGQLIALQDQRKWTPERVMEFVMANIEQGNQEALHGLVHETVGSA